MRGLVAWLFCTSLLIGSIVLIVPGSQAGPWTCGASTYDSDPLTEVVANGGFESDMVNWFTSGPVNLPTISTTIVHSGAKSARVQSVGTPSNAAQNLGESPFPAYVLSYWFYVATWGPGGHFSVQVMSNWSPSMGTADIASRVFWLPPNTMTWNVWLPNGGGGVTRTYARTLTTGSWHHLETVIDGTIGIQCLFIDGAFIDSASVSPGSTFAPTVIAFGDISQAGDAGDSYYDDLSILALNPGLPDYVPSNASPPAAFPAGEAVPTSLSIRVGNRASFDAFVASTVAFYNESTPGSPFATLLVPALSAGASSGPYTVTWTSPGVPGTYRIVAQVDYSGSVQELNEGNNRFTWTATVYPPPITTLTVGSPNYGWFITSSTALTLTPLDRSGTGILRTEYRIDSGPWQLYTAPFAMIGEGDRLVEWYSADNVGNVEATQAETLTVDDTAPTTTVVLGSPNYGAGFVTSSTPITLLATDGGIHPVGLDSALYRVDAGGWIAYSSAFTVSGEGTHTLEYSSTDLLGNVEPIGSGSVTVDDTGPTATVFPGNPSYTATDTWVTSLTPITIAASDRGAVPVGVESVDYRVWSGIWGAWFPYATPFTLPPEGRRYVEWQATDHLGNADAGNASLIVDDTAPSISFAWSGPYYSQSPDTWVTSSTTIAISAADGGVLPVGMGTLMLRTWFGSWSPWTAYVGQFSLSGEGRHYLEVLATDRLGNLLAINASYVVDDTGPAVSPSLTGPSFGPISGDTWVTSDSRFALSAADGGVLPVGIDTLEYRLWFGGWSPWGPYVTALALSEEGRHYVEWRARDFLGNQRVGNLSYVVDNTPPTSGSSLTGPTFTASVTYVTSATLIADTAVDGGPIPVGLDTIEVSLDGVVWTDYNAPFSMTGPDGPRALYRRALDRLGNMEPVGVLLVVLDNTAPATTIALPEGPLSIVSRYSLSASDGGSGLDRIEYRIDGGAWQAYQAPFTLPIGAHTIGYRATDRLGNQEAEHTAVVRVENWKPIVAILFAVILVVLAVLLAMRARRTEGSRWKSVAVTGIVFAAAEAATGVVSALIGALPIPPFVDLGTVVDVAILVAGVIAVSIVFLRRRAVTMAPEPAARA